MAVGRLSSADGRQIFFVPAGGNIGVERLDGQVVVSHNLWVSGIGSKFSTPINMLSPKDMPKLKGSLTIMPTSTATGLPTWNGAGDISPERPYIDSYGKYEL